jgi:hypothetical protein
MAEVKQVRKKHVWTELEREQTTDAVVRFSKRVASFLTRVVQPRYYAQHDLYTVCIVDSRASHDDTCVCVMFHFTRPTVWSMVTGPDVSGVTMYVRGLPVCGASRLARVIDNAQFMKQPSDAALRTLVRFAEPMITESWKAVSDKLHAKGMPKWMRLF